MAKTYNGNSIQLEVDCGDGGVSEAMKNNGEALAQMASAMVAESTFVRMQHGEKPYSQVKITLVIIPLFADDAIKENNDEISMPAEVSTKTH